MNTQITPENEVNMIDFEGTTMVEDTTVELNVLTVEDVEKIGIMKATPAYEATVGRDDNEEVVVNGDLKIVDPSVKTVVISWDEVVKNVTKQYINSLFKKSVKCDVVVENNGKNTIVTIPLNIKDKFNQTHLADKTEITAEIDMSVENLREMYKLGRIGIKVIDKDGNEVIDEKTGLPKMKKKVIKFISGLQELDNQIKVAVTQKTGKVIHKLPTPVKGDKTTICKLTDLAKHTADLNQFLKEKETKALGKHYINPEDLIITKTGDEYKVVKEFDAQGELYATTIKELKDIIVKALILNTKPNLRKWYINDGFEFGDNYSFAVPNIMLVRSIKKDSVKNYQGVEDVEFTFQTIDEFDSTRKWFSSIVNHIKDKTKEVKILLDNKTLSKKVVVKKATKNAVQEPEIDTEIEEF